ncbi:hypothetical protein [Paenibacillus xylanexedens]|uniref:hypothetical protein n=1 Tax=Paenibacillus xylanexedens TaxID=528191 RepID=UPI0011A55CD6|nr:hypothetical protein [Paenibacillus xylanexedens]
MDEKITYEEMIEFIWQQREIEFVYENKKYAFLSHKDGFMFVCDNQTQGSTYDTLDQMVKEIRINGKTFLELFKNDELTITAVL